MRRAQPHPVDPVRWIPPVVIDCACGQACINTVAVDSQPTAIFLSRISKKEFT